MNAAEVISGSASIKGSYSGAESYTPYLHTDYSIISFLPGKTYRITFSYRILTTPPRGFEVLFFSPTGGAGGSFLPSYRITGSTGDSGSVSLTNTLGPYTDYQARWNVIGTGEVAIDDIQIVNIETGQVAASENGERTIPQTTMSLSQVRSFLYLVWNGSSPRPNLADAVANSSADLILLGQLSPIDRASFDPRGNKIILAHWNLTEERYWNGQDVYLNPSAKPAWFGGAYPNDPVMFSVQYWNPLWRALVFTRLDQAIAGQYDGILLDSVLPSDWMEGNQCGNSVYPNAVQELATLVADIKTYVASKKLSRPFYIVPNVVDPTLVTTVPSALANFDAVFDELIAYGGGIDSNNNFLPGGVHVNNSINTKKLKSVVGNSGIPIFGNDYPSLANSDAILKSFSSYSELGIIPSVVNAADPYQTLFTGPFMFMAVPGNSAVTGTKSFVNYLSGGAATSATLVGGDKGDYFIGGPGKNTITGGAGNDTIYAHPARRMLELTVDAELVNITPPSIKIIINGKEALLATAVTADARKSQTQTIKVDVGPYGDISTFQLTGLGLSTVSWPNSFNNITVRSMSVGGASISFSAAQVTAQTAIQNSGTTVQLNDAGAGRPVTVVVPASAFPTVSPPLADTSDTIDGGGGVNTVIYRGKYAEYTIALQTDGSWLVTSTSPGEGPDTLRNIQQLVFSDVTVPLVQVSQGWSLIGNATAALLNVANVFGDTGKINSVWSWNAGASRWAFYSPSLTGTALRDYATSKGYDVLTTINSGDGFWVNAKTAFTAQLPAGAAVASSSFQNLASGWHLISTNDIATPGVLNDALNVTAPAAGVVPQNFSTLWAWDNAQSKWYFYAPSLQAQGGTALSDYVTAHGYLDFTSANKTLGSGVGFWVNKP